MLSSLIAADSFLSPSFSCLFSEEALELEEEEELELEEELV